MNVRSIKLFIITILLLNNNIFAQDAAKTTEDIESIDSLLNESKQDTKTSTDTNVSGTTTETPVTTPATAPIIPTEEKKEETAKVENTTAPEVKAEQAVTDTANQELKANEAAMDESKKPDESISPPTDSALGEATTPSTTKAKI